MRINMETRNYIHYVVVSFAKSNWTVIVYIFFNITLHKQMEQFDTQIQAVLYEFLTGRETTFYCTKVLRLWDEMFALYTKKAH